MPAIIYRNARVIRALGEHRHAVIVVALLTLALTFPTIIYVFKTDVFWLPTGKSIDVFIQLWNVWYGKQVLIGQADPFSTNFIFYPEGASLVYHPLFIPHAITVNALRIFLPLPNAFSLTHILIICSSALAAYIYLFWLFKDKWIALFGAIVFGLSPHVIGHANHPPIAFIAPIPLALYCFQRGVYENRPGLIIVAGLITGMTSTVAMYLFVTTFFLLAAVAGALARSRWRDRRFWLLLILLALAATASSWWRIYPMIENRQTLDQAIAWHGESEIKNDAIAFFVNHENPLVGRLLGSIADSPDGVDFSTTSYLGYLPLILCCYGLVNNVNRRKMLPWAILCAGFLVLRLGSHLSINGTAYTEILLPKHFLNQILPIIFEAFWEADHFMIGALLPFAVLTCYGLAALQRRLTIASKPVFILALVLIVAIEYYMPVQGKTISAERFAYLDWLAKDEDNVDIRLINLPMGRNNSKRYNLFQALSGFPHVEGAVSRTPESAFAYIQSNRLLDAWHRQGPIHCEMMATETYLAGLAQLQDDGFSHVVYHRFYQHAPRISESFRGIRPSYSDDSVSIYRLKDLRESCPSDLGIRHQFTSDYARALQKPALRDARGGQAVVFPPTPAANDHFMRYLRHFAQLDRTIVTVASDERGFVEAQSSAYLDSDPGFDLEQQAALWLVNDYRQFDAAQTRAYQEWFAPRFRFCARHYQDESTTIDLYLRTDIPCSAMDENAELEVQYVDGLRLHNSSFDFGLEKLRFYLAWSNNTSTEYGFSLQFFDEGGNKALQYDNVIGRDLLAVHEVDSALLEEGAYSVRLIIYDFETRKSMGGTVLDSGERFERELEIARIEV